MAKSRYEKRGVSSDKTEVHKAVAGANMEKSIFPNSFCTILPDYLGGDKKFCNFAHADGAGTKSSLAYIYWKETGDLSVWKGIAQDAIVMNIDDLVCSGAGLHGETMLLTMNIGRNKHLIPGEVIAEIIKGAQEFCDLMERCGINIKFAGGETADIGDIVRTISVDATITVRSLRSHIIPMKINTKSVIVGLSSTGSTSYENEENSGIGSNGLTSARHDILDKKYTKKYPESFSPETDKKLIYTGDHYVEHSLRIRKNPLVHGKLLPIGKAILSPTRTYAPVLRAIMKLKDDDKVRIHGIIHCSGGGQTKVMKFLPDHVGVLKHNLFPTPSLFSLIQRESGTGWKEMYKVFNMGHRMEIYCGGPSANRIISIAEKFGLEAKIIGYCERRTEGDSKLTIKTKHGNFSYE